MNTQTIQEISDQIKQVEQALQNFAVGQHEGETYGSEGEYTPQSLKGGIKAILTDLRGLVKAHNRFVQCSNYNERNSINDSLVNLASLLTQEDYSGAAGYLDKLKPTIRNFSIRGSSETKNALEERANRLNDQCSLVEEQLNEIEKIATKAEEADDKFKSAEGELESLRTAYDELQSKHDQIANLQNLSQENHQTIESALTSAKNHENNINSFVQRVEKRESQLDKQEQTTTAYQEQLTVFEKEHKEKLQEAEKLIEKARNALGYQTASGISAAFVERYKEDQGRKAWGWIVGSVLFVLGGIGIGVWWLFLGQVSSIVIAMSRIAVMSVTLSAAWFCAAQYTKYKNTMEDYGYKAVLAKSMTGFLDQLDGQERERYLEMVLLEIHKDPLRKRHDVHDGAAQGLVGLLLRKKKKADDEDNV